MQPPGLRLPKRPTVVNGATGNIGSGAVAVALAMGAGRVGAPGRNQAALDLLADRFGPLVRPVTSPRGRRPRPR